MDANYQAGKNFLWLSIAQAGVRLLGVAFYVFLARRLLDTGIGVYNFIGSFVPFWFIIIDFGAGDYLYREWSKRQSSVEEVTDDFDILFTARLLVTLSVFVIFFAVNYFINREIIGSLVLFYASMFLSTFLHLYDLYLQSHNQFRYTAIRQIIEKTAVVAFGVVFLYLKASVALVFTAILLSQVASGVYYYWKVISLKVRLAFNWQRSKELFVRGLPFMFIGLFASVYARIDMVMLRYMKDFGSVGWYGAAYKFLDISALFSSLFVSSLFPVLASLYSDPERREEYHKMYFTALRIIFSAGILIATAFIFFAPKLISLFFPSSFGPAVLALRILMIAQVLMFLSILFSNLLIIQNNERRGLSIIVISASVNIILNFLLIPRFSLYGAAWATVLAEAVNLFLLQHYVEWIKERRMLLLMLVFVIGNLLTMAALKYTGRINSIPLGAAAVILNIVLLWICRLLRWEDMRMFFDPLKNKLTNWFGSEM